MLVVTIHDVAPAHLPAVRELRARTLAWGAAHVTLLAIPDYHGRGRLASCTATASWLRACARLGDEVAMHGIEHRARGAVHDPIDRARARLWTAGEGEMLGTYAPTAAQLSIERERLAQLVGCAIRGFVAPAWLEPRGFARRVADAGFAWHETKWSLEHVDARVRLFTPAIGFATRTRLREHAALAWARLALPLANRTASAAHPARIALHPADLRSRSVMAAAERVVRTLARRHAAVTTSRALGVD